MKAFFAAVISVTVAACASMGRPEGGPRDETPPRFVRSTPAPGSLNFSGDRVSIFFDENIQVKDVMDRVVVSPPQKNMPKVMAVGRNIRVDLADTLQPNTTYTIDFTDAISDLNENNPYEGFAIDFSTGPTIDTLCISGMVFQAETLEPAQGMLVGVHSNLADSAIRTLPFDRITKTNQYGQFTVRNLKEGPYRIFAINDVNRDNKWDRSEDIAFYDVTVSPSARPEEVTDTLVSAAGDDSLAVRTVTRFLPDDVLLTWFNEDYKSQYLAKHERRERNKIYFEMGANADSLPRIRFVGGPYDGRKFERYSVLNGSKTLDTLEYWLTDTALIALDSIKLEVEYMRTDTLDNLVWGTDTLQFNMRKQKQKAKKKEKKESENADSAAMPELTFLNLKTGQGTLEVYSPLMLEADQPVKHFADTALRLEIMVDTLWQEVARPKFYRPDSLRPMVYRADVKWEPGGKYRLTVDSLAVTGIYDQWNKELKYEFTVRNLEDYANLTFNISGPEGPAVVQLLDNQDRPVRAVSAEGGKAVFENVTPGTFYARLFIDRNANGKWDTGNLADSVQPEETFYFSKKINLKKNWDVEQQWDIYELPVDMQKPLDIKKNKPKNKKTDRPDGYDEEDDQYYDEFGNPAVDPDDPFGKRKGHRYNDLHGRDNNTGQGAGYRGGRGNIR